MEWRLDLSSIIGAARAEHGEPSSSEIKKLSYKNDDISEGCIFSNNISKGLYKFNFSIEFLSKIFKNLSKFPNNLCFSSKRA